MSRGEGVLGIKDRVPGWGFVWLIMCRVNYSYQEDFRLISAGFDG